MTNHHVYSEVVNPVFISDLSTNTVNFFSLDAICSEKTLGHYSLGFVSTPISLYDEIIMDVSCKYLVIRCHSC